MCARTTRMAAAQKNGVQTRTQGGGPVLAAQFFPWRLANCPLAFRVQGQVAFRCTSNDAVFARHNYLPT
jgi:hypothetical protein